MSRTFRAMMASAIVASMLIVPAAAQADQNKTPSGDHCVKFESFGASTITGSAANGLTVSLDGIDDPNEPTEFHWTANGVASLHVKAAGYFTSEAGSIGGYYVQGQSDDGKHHAISHVVFCGDPGDGGDGDNPPPTPPPCSGDLC
ncbi:MAG: hypothetical protein OEM94_06335 [Acidimicrobiia bacterium]|nr:hypothetical protein [Acidimicrobiia bacterium]